ncbi:MAG: hypothetical protein MRERV_12c021 [Mycoplasmataceae bacterium RV_VA103A]|nr:MAG: hypothetical protein MRERV_12c021 [Mycoplasmataceae bacterium RV_VA103A]
MTNYNLQDFATWLTNTSQNFPSHHLNYYQNVAPYAWKQDCERRDFKQSVGEQSQTIILEWMEEVDQRENMLKLKLEDFKTWLNADPTRKGNLKNWSKVRECEDRDGDTFIQTLGVAAPGEDFYAYDKIKKQWQKEVAKEDLKKWVLTNQGDPNSPAWNKIFDCLQVDLAEEMKVLAQLICEWDSTWGNLKDLFYYFQNWHQTRRINLFNISKGESEYFFYLNNWKELIERKIQIQEKEIAELQKRLEELKQNIQQSEQEKKKLQEQVKQKEQHSTSYQSKIENLNSEIANKEQEITEWRKKIEEYENRILDYQNQLSSLKQREKSVPTTNQTENNWWVNKWKEYKHHCWWLIPLVSLLIVGLYFYKKLRIFND